VEIPKSEPFVVAVQPEQLTTIGVRNSWPSLVISFATAQDREEWRTFIKNIRREQAGLEPERT
jgi:hypothetical protein